MRKQNEERQILKYWKPKNIIVCNTCRLEIKHDELLSQCPNCNMEIKN